ncbi:MAG: transporter [Bacteroidota bacterium]
MPLPLRLFAILGIFLLTASVARAQEGDIVAERPGHFLVPTLITPLTIQLETGVTVQRDENVRNGTRFNATQVHYLTTAIRVGLLKTVEVRLLGEYLNDQLAENGKEVQAREGINGLGIGAKIMIREEDGALPETSFLFQLGLPVGNSDFAPPFSAPSFTLGLHNTLSDAFGLYYGVSGSWDGINAAGSGGYTVALTETITPKVSGFIEAYGTFIPHNPPSHAIDAGLGIIVAPSLQLDIFGGKGLTKHAPDLYFSAGICYRLPRWGGWPY